MLNLRSILFRRWLIFLSFFLLVFFTAAQKAVAQDSSKYYNPDLFDNTHTAVFFSAVDMGIQINPSGYNSLLRISSVSGKHKYGFGLSYNLSDGFINAPVLGPELHYGYIVSLAESHFVDLGLQYQRQRVNSELAYSQFHLRSGFHIIVPYRWMLNLDMGVGFYRNIVRTKDLKIIQSAKSAHIGLSCAYAFLL